MANSKLELGRRAVVLIRIRIHPDPVTDLGNLASLRVVSVEIPITATKKDASPTSSGTDKVGIRSISRAGVAPGL